MPKINGYPYIPDGLESRLKGGNYNPFLPHEDVSQLTCLAGFGLWTPSDLSTNPETPETKRWEQWGWNFLAVIDRFNLALPIPPRDPTPSGDALTSMLMLGRWFYRRAFGSISHMLPYFYWSPEWARYGAEHGYQVFVPKFDSSTAFYRLAAQENPYSKQVAWGQFPPTPEVPAPTIEAMLWELEKDHAMRNNHGKYQCPYGPGVWLRREGKPFEVLKMVWRADWNRWEDQTPPAERQLQEVSGQKLWDELTRFRLYGGYEMREKYDERVFGPVPNPPRRPFPSSVEEMEEVIRQAAPTPGPSEPTLYDEIITHGQKLADFGDMEMWVSMGKAYLVVQSTKTVLAAQG